MSPKSKIPLSPSETLANENEASNTSSCLINDRTRAVNASAHSSTQLEESPTSPATSSARKWLLLIVFCLAQFLDVFNVSALMSSIPSIASGLDMTASESTWIISAFQLTFSSFLLVSGKISDVFNAKYAFVIGITVLGILSIVTGFLHNKIAFIVLRAFCGIGKSGSLTIPASLTLIVRIFPEPEEQGRAISMFGSTGAIGNVMGLIIGALFTQYTSWRWIFWFATILALSVGLIGFFFIPAETGLSVNETRKQSVLTRVKYMDLPGVACLTVAMILFILALTESTNSGWGSAIVITPLVISIIIVISFFFYEKRVDQAKAAIPSQTWFYKNFSVLFGTSLILLFWWVNIFVKFNAYWQEVFGWSVIMCAVRMLPIGVVAWAMSFTTPLASYISPKWILLAGYAGTITGTVLLIVGGSDKLQYWSYVFPAFIIGSGGTMLVYVFSNIGIFRSTPPKMAGTVGAMFNGALQLGSAVGNAAVTSIELSVESKSENGRNGFDGRQAGLWFVLATILLGALSVFGLYDTTPYTDEEINQPDSEKSAAEIDPKASEQSSV